MIISRRCNEVRGLQVSSSCCYSGLEPLHVFAARLRTRTLGRCARSSHRPEVCPTTDTHRCRDARSHGAGWYWIAALAPRRGVWLESQSSATAPARELLEGDPQASSGFVAVLACMAPESHLLVSMAFLLCTAYLPLK